MRRAVVILLSVIIAGVIVWFFPLFHIVRTSGDAATNVESDFNASATAETFWTSKLAPAIKQGPNAATVLQALRSDGKKAREEYGRKVGVSRTTLFVVRGSGQIVSVGKEGVGVALTDGAQDADVVLKSGLIFGNIVRDATGLFDASVYSNSGQPNDVSTELNRIVETRILPKLKEAAKDGRRVSFAGCTEIPDDASNIRPLAIVPLDVVVE